MAYKASSIQLRPVRATTSLRERQALARGIIKKPKPPRDTVVTICLNSELHAELSKRGDDVAGICAAIVGGVLTRGSLSEVLNAWGDHETDERRCMTTSERRVRRRREEKLKLNGGT